MAKSVEERKAAFVAALALTGLTQKSCDEAGIPARRLQEWRRDDHDFDSEVRDAERRFAERIEAHALDLALNGTVKKRYNKEGEVIGEETVYPVNLLTTILRRHCPAYRERNEIDVSVQTVGVLAVGAPIASAAEWRKQCEGKPDAQELDSAEGAPRLGCPDSGHVSKSDTASAEREPARRAQSDA